MTGVVPGKNTVVKDSNDSAFNIIGKGFVYAYIGNIDNSYSINYGGETMNYPNFKKINTNIFIKCLHSIK